MKSCNYFSKKLERKTNKCFLLFFKEDKVTAANMWFQRPWKIIGSPGGMNKQWSKVCCLVSAHNASPADSDAFTNEDGLRMMTQVGFNSVFCQKEKEQRERDVSQTLEVNSIYYKAQRCGFDLFFWRAGTYSAFSISELRWPFTQ